MNSGDIGFCIFMIVIGVVYIASYIKDAYIAKHTGKTPENK